MSESGPEEVSHLKIYSLLIEVKTTLEMTLKQRAEDRARDDSEKNDIFKRLKDLEGSSAKWAGVALAASAVGGILSFAISATVTALAPRLTLGHPPVAPQVPSAPPHR